MNVAILTLVAEVSTPLVGAAKHKHALSIASNATGSLNILLDGTVSTNLFSNTTNGTSTIDLQSNSTLLIADIKSSTNMTRAGAYGVALDAFEGAYPTGIIKIGNVASLTDESYSLGATNATVAFTASHTDLVNLTINGKLLSGTLINLAAMVTGDGSSAYGAASTTSPTAEEVIDWIAGAWEATYVTGASATESLFKVATETGGQLTISAKDASGRRGYDKGYSLSITTASTTMSSAVYGLSYGATTDPSDNNTISGGIIVTVEAGTGGTLLDETAGLLFQASADDVASTTANRISLLDTTELLNSDPQVNTTTSLNIFPNEARGDVRNAEGQKDKVITTPGTTFSRVTWL